MTHMNRQVFDTADEGLRSQLLTLNDVSEYLNCSYSTTLRLVSRGELEACRIGTAWRTSKSACDNYIRRQFAEQRIICKSVDVEE